MAYFIGNASGLIYVHVIIYLFILSAAASQRSHQAREHVHAAAATHALHAGLQHGGGYRHAQPRRVPPQGAGTSPVDGDAVARLFYVLHIQLKVFVVIKKKSDVGLFVAILFS